MDAATIWRHLSQRPFRPFVIATDDGCTYRVDRPGMAMMTPNTFCVGVNPDADGIFETVRYYDLSQVRRIEPIASAA